MLVRECNVKFCRRDFFITFFSCAIATFFWFLKQKFAHSTEADVDALVHEKLNGILAKTGKITLDIPEVAENGASVQFTVTVESPMTEQDYVTAIHVFTEGNATPHVASYYLTPFSGKARLTSRFRLARKQHVRVLALMSDGAAYVARREVTVAVGGC